MPLFSAPESDFRANTRQFLMQQPITGYRLNHTPLLAGRQHVYLAAETVNGQQVVTLDAMPPSRWIGRSTPVPVWWVPQGGSCAVPVHPVEGDPRIVFTPDFSGCSLVVDQRDADTYEIYHVTGGDAAFQAEYGGKSHGLGVAGFLVFSDYGMADLPRAFLCMRYDDTARTWLILSQSQTGLVGLGGSRDGPLVATESLRVWSTGTSEVADLSKEPARRDAAAARHGSFALAGA